MINIYKPELTNLQQAILRLLFVKTGNPLNQRAVAKTLKVSPPAVIKALPKLEEKGLIKLQQDKDSKRWSIEINKDSKIILQLKRADNLKLLYESGLADFLEKEFAGATIMLFGSYSRGEDTISSDIDVAIIGRKYKTLNLEKFQSVLERSININFYASWGRIDSHLKNNILNGIILAGGIEL